MQIGVKFGRFKVLLDFFQRLALGFRQEERSRDEVNYSAACPEEEHCGIAEVADRWQEHSSEQDAASLGNGSLYDLLGQHGRIPVRSEQSAQAALANSEEATLLNIETGRPVLRFERLSFDANEDPIEFVTSTYRSDKYSLYVLLKK